MHARQGRKQARRGGKKQKTGGSPDAPLFAAASIDTRLATALGISVDVNTDARAWLYMLSRPPLPFDCAELDGVMRAGAGACTGDSRGRRCGGARCPSSDRAFAADRGVIVRLRLAPTVDDPAESSPESASESAFESESGSDDVECVDAAARRCRVLCAGGDVRASADGGRPNRDAPSRPTSADDGDGDGNGEFAALRRAAISRNAATEIRCGESAVGDVDADPKLPARGRVPPTARLLAEMPDSADGGRSSGSSGGPGDAGRTWRNARRLNAPSSGVGVGAGAGDGLLFLRSRCAHENMPFFGGAGGGLGSGPQSSTLTLGVLTEDPPA